MIFITGATGFIGRNVLTYLIDTIGAQNIRILLFESEKEFLNDYPGVEGVIGTLSDRELLDKACAGAECVIHLASKNIDHDGSGFEEINVRGTENLCEAAASQGTQRFLYLSSVGVYGHKRHAGNDETTPVKPDTDFSRSKVAAENHIIEYTKNGKFKGIILRHRFVYGEGEQHVIPRMMKAARKYSFLVGRGRARMSFILVRELADIIYRFTKTALPDEDNIVYHVNDGEPVSYKEIVYLLADMFGFKKPKTSIPFWLLHTPVAVYECLFRIDPEATKSSMSSIRLKLVAQDNYFSNEKLRGLFPDMQLTPLKEALPKLKDYYSQFM